MLTSFLPQTALLTKANLGSVPRRIWISLSMVLSIGLVVLVLVGFLAMASGFKRTLSAVGDDRVAIILGSGTLSELDSRITDADRHLVQSAPESVGLSRDDAGRVLASSELIVPVDARRDVSAPAQTLSLRGMGDAGLHVRAAARISEGRLFAPGTPEIVVGGQLAQEFPGFAVGDHVRFGPTQWTVAGHFTAAGSGFESEIWADGDVVRALFDRPGETQIMRVRLVEPAALERLRDYLVKASPNHLTIMSERAFYAGQTQRTVQLIELFGWPIALLIAVGATAGALNTMMSSVSDRAIEIATLRAVGFSRAATIAGTWIEAMALTALGAGVGVAGAWVLFDGLTATTTGANHTQVAFQLAVSPDVLLQACLLALAIGVIGGGLPALQAARLPLTRALQRRS